MKIAPPQKKNKTSAPKLPFWSENSDSSVFGGLLRGNKEEFWEN